MDSARIPYGFLTVDEAAELLGVSPEVVVQLLVQDALHGTRVGRTWRINPWSLYPMVLARAVEEESGGPPEA